MSQAESRQPDQEPQPSFEQALQELQQIVAELERGDIGLEESLQKFERGVKLLRCCYQILEQAEQRIEILTGIDEQGRPVTEPFDASATIEQTSGAAGRRRQQTQSSGLFDQPTDDAQPDDDVL